MKLYHNGRVTQIILEAKITLITGKMLEFQYDLKLLWVTIFLKKSNPKQREQRMLDLEIINFCLRPGKELGELRTSDNLQIISGAFYMYWQ